MFPLTKEQILFSLLRSEIAGETVSLDDAVTPALLDEVMNLAKFHKIEHIAANALLKSGVLTDADVFKKYQRIVMFEIAIDARRTCALQAIQAVFEENRIDYILLKGSVIRHLYPETWMRNSCDIDILVRPEELDRAVEVLASQLGYTVTDREVHDVAMIFEETRLELHFSLIEEGRAKQATDILNDVWTCAERRGDGYEFVLPEDLSYFYHIAHMAKHITNGGCGIRNFADVWLLNLRGQNLDNAKQLLLRGGLLTVTEAIEHLARVWFGNESHTETSLEFERFILGSGTYGAFDNRVLLTKINFGGNGQGVLSYYLPRLFMPLRLMRIKYPVLERWPVLLPFLWAYRIVEMLLSKTARSRAKAEVSNVARVDDSESGRLQNLMKSLDL